MPQLTQPVDHSATGASAVNEDRVRPVLLCNLRNLGRDRHGVGPCKLEPRDGALPPSWALVATPKLEDGAIVYANKRAEMWGAMRAWLAGGMIPDDRELLADLTGVEYGYALREGRDAIISRRKRI